MNAMCSTRLLVKIYNTHCHLNDVSVLKIPIFQLERALPPISLRSQLTFIFSGNLRFLSCPDLNVDLKKPQFENSLMLMGSLK